MGKFWETDEEKKRFFKYFQILHKNSGHELPDEDMEKFFATTYKECEIAKKCLDEKHAIDQRAGKSVYKIKEKGYSGEATVGRAHSVMLKNENTGDAETDAANKAYNEKLDALYGTRDGDKEILGMFVDEISQIDISIFNGSVEQMLENWQKNPRAFRMAFVVVSVVDNYRSQFHDKDEVINQIIKNRLQFERAGAVRIFAEFVGHELYPYFKGVDLSMAYDSINTEKKLDGKKIDTEDRKKLSGLLNAAAFYYDDMGTNILGKKDKAAVRKVFETDYADFRKSFKNDKDMYDAIIGRIRNMNVYVKSDLTDAQKSLLPKEEIVLVEFAGNAKKILEENSTKAHKNPGKDLYDKLKWEYIVAGRITEKAMVEAEYNNPANNHLHKTDDSRFVDEMIKLLDEGDKWYRGSSSAYKDIKSQLNELKTLIDNHDQQRFKTNPALYKRIYDNYVISIRDKALRYTKGRQTVAVEYSADSYKGKRVDRMYKVFSRINKKAETLKNEGLYSSWDKGTIVPVSYGNDLKESFESSIFSAKFLAEKLAANDLKTEKGDVTFEQLMKKADEFYASDAMRLITSYYGESKTDMKDAENNYKAVKKALKTYNDNMKSFDEKMLQQEKERLTEIKNTYTLGKILKENVEFLLEDKIELDITGDRRLDVKIVKEELKLVENALNKIKDVQKEKKNEAEVVPVQ